MGKARRRRMSQRVLITGALGFFGSHLADRYSELGWYVCGIDNMTANVVSVTHPTVDSMMIGDARALTPKHVASVGGSATISNQGKSGLPARDGLCFHATRRSKCASSRSSRSASDSGGRLAAGK